MVDWGGGEGGIGGWVGLSVGWRVRGEEGVWGRTGVVGWCWDGWFVVFGRGKGGERCGVGGGIGYVRFIL